MINLNLKSGIVLLLVELSSVLCFGQIATSTSVPYYIDLNSKSHAKVYEIIDGVGHIKYFDEQGIDKYLNIQIYDWKHEKVANYSLAKSYGLNHYEIKMDWLMPDQVYFVEATAENNRRFNLAIQGKGHLKNDPPNPQITVNPIQLSCELEAQNSVEYYVSISGGRAPYKAHWFVLDESMSKMLYQPRQEVISKAGKGMMVMIDKSPVYTVLLKVEDACGNEAKRIVKVNCEDGDKVFHSIFVEPVSIPESVTSNIK